MMKKATSILMLLAMLAAGVQTAFAQGDCRDYERGWYAGLSGGTVYWDGSAYQNDGEAYLARSPLTYQP